MQFKATCSKGNKKLTLVLNATDIDNARNILHGQGYSIIELTEGVVESKEEGNFFYFDAIVGGILQSGKIKSTDIFKSYKKLTEDLKYNIVYIYTNEGMPEESKKVITAKVRDGYRLYRESMGVDLDLEEEKMGQTQDQQEMQEISGEVLKELAKYTTVIDSSVEKIQNIFLKYHQTISSDQRMALEELENSLIQIKGSKNLGKMKMVVENGLKQIGETELALLKNGMTEEKKQFLAETNALLKQVGSKNKIESQADKENSIEFKINNFFNKTPKPAEATKPAEAPKKEKKDTNSFIYFKNKRELDIYIKKLNSIEMEIIKTILSFQFSKLKKLSLKKKLIAQNIEIIDNRINNRVISYTKMIHGMEYYLEKIFLGVQLVTNILFYAIFIYTIAYFILSTLDNLSILPNHINGKSIIFITIFSVSVTILSYIRGVLSAVFFTPILFFVIYFLSVNF